MTAVHPAPVSARQVRPPPEAPLAMLAELTHRCPLACPYCSNPLELTGRERELTAEQWAGVFRQAAGLGVLQLHLSGGEPASRPDLVQIVAAAREAGLYTNLITSGIGLTARRLEELDAAGLDHVQLSLQGVNAGIADHVGGWALRNRAALQPTREQVEDAKRIVAQARVDYAGRLSIDFVPPDYFADFPKACMNGWGSTGLNIAPDGKVLPCHAAEIIPGLQFQNVLTTPLAEIWNGGPAFNAFRGTDWMPELCQACDRRDIDYGGCRCQAMALAGDARATDPVCRRSPHRAALDALIAAETGVAPPPFEYRRMPH